MRDSNHVPARGLAPLSLVTVAASLVIASPIHAQDRPPSDAVREGVRIQREQDLRREQQFREDRRSARPPAQLEAPAVPESGTAPGGCRDIERIELQGARKLAASKREALVRPYLGRCLGVADIERLLADITRAYIERGYATARAYLPGGQDLSTGTLQILVVEGEVSELRLEDGGEKSVNLKGAFPGIVGHPLNLRDLEQGLDQLNRLSSNNARLDLAPGEEPGETVVVITNEPTHRWHLGLSFDNYGVRSTGRYQLGATVSYDNLLGPQRVLQLHPSSIGTVRRARAKLERRFVLLLRSLRLHHPVAGLRPFGLQQHA